MYGMDKIEAGKRYRHARTTPGLYPIIKDIMPEAIEKLINGDQSLIDCFCGGHLLKSSHGLFHLSGRYEKDHEEYLYKKAFMEFGPNPKDFEDYYYIGPELIETNDQKR